MAHDRKALSRVYKNTPRTMGVGVVRNTANGKVLVLAGQNIRALLNRNQAQLRLGVHRNQALQHDWQNVGEQRFTFEVVDTLTPKEIPGYDPTEDLRVLEQLWLERLSPIESIYNSQYTPPH
jgi:hypothetical protein